MGCPWRWTTSLYFPQRERRFGRALLRRALADWPVQFADRPAWRGGSPQVSFVIGHRGAARIPLLELVLASLAAQREVSCEVIVVEQSTEALLARRLPDWVGHLHTPPPRPDMPYSRAWAFNCGARAAAAQALVFLDGDVCVPRDFARELLLVLDSGFEAARLQRFVFYLTAAATEGLVARRAMGEDTEPEQVVQNCQGHVLGVRRSTYFDVGGHDEGFLGWGGEDNEMFDRLRARRFHDHAYLPFLHLHHAPQAEKLSGGRSPYFEERMGVPAAARIAELRARNMGQPAGPWPATGGRA